GCRRLEGNPLDLNSLPEEHGKHPLEESSLTAAASGSKKTKGAVKDDSAKVYECRFCSLKFCKSQALGGHMNRHRQGKRETETLNRARQLVFSNDGAIGYVLPSRPSPFALSSRSIHGYARVFVPSTCTTSFSSCGSSTSTSVGCHVTFI
ncbi:zinc finger protein, partial [Musa troglodytarum]